MDARRRGIVTALGTAPLAPWLSPASRATRRNPLWRTAVALGGFAASGRRARRTHALADVLSYAARAGFDGVELAPGDGGYPRPADEERVRELERPLQSFALHPFALRLASDDLFAPDANRRGRWLDRADEHAALAQRLGASHLAVATSGGLDGQTIEEALGLASAALRATAELTARRRLIVALEVPTTSVFDRADHLRRILHNAAHPLVRPIYDPLGFARLARADPLPLLVSLGVGHVAYVRLPAAAAADQLPSLRLLRERGYRGWVVADPSTAPDPYGACTAAKAVLDVAAR